MGRHHFRQVPWIAPDQNHRPMAVDRSPRGEAFVTEDMARKVTVAVPGVPQTSQASISSTPPFTTGAAEKAIGYVQMTSAERKRPPDAVDELGVLRLVLVQIWVPSANRTNSPLALLPRSIAAPVGMPDACETSPSKDDWLKTSAQDCQMPPEERRCQVLVALSAVLAVQR